MQSNTLLETYNRVIYRPHPILVWVNSTKSKSEPYKCQDSGLKEGIKVKSWRQMIDELKAAGYTSSKISRATGLSRRSVQRWFGSKDELTHHKLFSNILYLYCHYKKEGGVPRSVYATKIGRN